MSKQGAAKQQRVQALLWSEFLALWMDRTRRRALPLLLATLLLLIPSLPASAECTCEVPGTHHHEAPHSAHEAHHHEHAKARTHGHAAEHSHASSPQVRAALVNGGHSHTALSSRVAPARGETACCACPRVPIVPSVAAQTPPSSGHADSQILVYTRSEALPAFGLDALTGLFGRAGPPPESKPKLLFLASLAGRAPPVSI